MGKIRGTPCMRIHFRYSVPLPNIFLTRLFSKLRLKRKDFQEILRLPWAQEACGSNPDAPTNKFKSLESVVHLQTLDSTAQEQGTCRQEIFLPLLLGRFRRDKFFVEEQVIYNLESA